MNSMLIGKLSAQKLNKNREDILCLLKEKNGLNICVPIAEQNHNAEKVQDDHNLALVQDDLVLQESPDHMFG